MREEERNLFELIKTNQEPNRELYSTLLHVCRYAAAESGETPPNEIQRSGMFDCFFSSGPSFSQRKRQLSESKCRK